MRFDEFWCKEDFEDRYEPCDRCGSYDRCSCRKPRLSSDYGKKHDILVNKVVCSKQVQKVAEATIPLSALGIVLTPGEPIPLITLTPDLAGIVQNSAILRDEVVNTGYVPATITVAGIPTPVTVSLPFQQHTPCPGACPEDILTEAPLEVEGIIIQPVPLAVIGGVVGVASALFKVVLRTTITVTRPMLGRLGHKDLSSLCDVNTHRCDNGTPRTLRFPLGTASTATAALGVAPQNLGNTTSQNTGSGNTTPESE